MAGADSAQKGIGRLSWRPYHRVMVGGQDRNARARPRLSPRFLTFLKEELFRKGTTQRNRFATRDGCGNTTVRLQNPSSTTFVGIGATCGPTPRILCRSM